MRLFFLLLISIIIFPENTSAKKLDSLKYTQHKELIFDWDNDILVFKDYYYTQGAHIFYINPALRKNPANHILFQLKNADYYYGLGVIQEIYTPKDLIDTLLNTIDRPYAGTFYIRSFATSVISNKKIRFTNQLDIGLLGPLSGAEQAQRIIHDWLDLGFPNGWDFQIENRPYLNYNFLVDKGLLSVNGIFDFMGNSRLRVGNIHDDLQVGANIRIGRLNNFFKGYNLGNKSYGENHDFQFYVFGSANVTAVLYNATLMGGIIPPENSQHFKLKDIENVIGELKVGAQITYKFVGVKMQTTWKTPEFEGGEKHGWGTIAVYFRF
ncbi:MAG: lipid A deacylase LpxR family protein [Draconibacterium sp.]|nr:lipid A deacylase LpxR family protein [Draconibacterium sp.]